MNKNKKILLIVGGGVVIIGLIAYFFVFRGKTPTLTPSDQPTRQGIGSPITNGRPSEEKTEEETTLQEEAAAAEDKLIRITDFAVVGPSLNRVENKILFYKKDGGDLWSADFNGKNLKKESTITIIGLTEAVWSPTKDRAAVFYLDRDINKSFIHIGTSSVAILPQNIKSFSWSPDGRSAAYLVEQNRNLNLVVADNLGRNSRTIFTTPIMDAQISWVTAGRIALQTAPSGLVESYLFSLPSGGGTLSKILSGTFGLMTKWSLDGSRFLASLTDSTGQNLRIAINDSQGGVVYDTTLPTIPDKCAWAGNQRLYCAVSTNLSSTSVLPDDYLSGEINTLDQIFVIDLASKTVDGILNKPDFDVSDILASQNQSYLFFVNRIDGTLWSLRIK